MRDGKIITWNSLENTSKILIGLLILAVAGIGFFSQPFADDFANTTQILGSGIFDYVKKYYFEGTGRIFPVAIGWIFLRNSASFTIASIILSILFMIIPIITIKYFKQKEQFIHENTTLFVVLTAYLFGFHDFLPQNVFWPTGGDVYLFSFFSYLVWFIGYTHVLKTRQLFGIFILSVTGLIIGTAHEQLSVSLLFIAFCILINKYWPVVSKKKKMEPRDLLLFMPVLSLIIGSFILIIAPGNYVRAKSYPAASLMEIIGNSKATIGYLFHASKAVLIFGSISGFIAGFINLYKRISIRDNIKGLVLVFILVLSAILTLIPLLPFPSMVQCRTLFFGAIFLFAASFIFMKMQTELFLHVIRLEKDRFSINMILALVAVLLISVMLRLFKFKFDFILTIATYAFSLLMLLLYSYIGKTGKLYNYLQRIIFLKNNNRYLLIFSIFIFFVAFVVNFQQISTQYSTAVPFKKAGKERDAFLKSVPVNYPDGSTVYVPPFPAKYPTWLNFMDLTTDPKQSITYARPGRGLANALSTFRGSGDFFFVLPMCYSFLVEPPEVPHRGTGL